MKTKLFYSILLLVCTSLGACASTIVNQDEAQKWLLYVAPLPKEISIDSKVSVKPDSIAIYRPAVQDQVIEQACKELRKCLWMSNTSNPYHSEFTIKMQLGGLESESLKTLKNSDQAYRIIPNNNSLQLVALHPRGLYYAAKTLQQLIKPYSSQLMAVIPILNVTDWPDIEDRGLWGSDSSLHLKWMGDLKMNINEQISARSVDEKGRGHSFPKGDQGPIYKEGPLYGIKPVPVVLHLEQTSYTMIKAYPNLKPIGIDNNSMCYSQPQVVDVVADWIVELGSLPNVNDVDVWMTENLHNKGGCKCEECSKVDRSVLEARVIVAAWKKAKQRLPNIGIRTLSSEETAKANGAIIKELPKEVKFWYYHSQLTYMNAETPMITEELEGFARAGRWIGVCPSLTHNVQPFTSPQFVHYRGNEFVDKNISGVIGYSLPRTEFGLFNEEGLAEWSWNSKGRTPREFAESYAVRNGIKDPEKFAEWAMIHGEVAWDVFGSDWPNGDKKGNPGHAANLLRAGRLPDLGVVTYVAYRSPFADIKTVDQLNSDVGKAAKAVALAKAMGIPLYIQESVIVQGYINSLKALYELKGLITVDGVAPENKEKARKYFQMYLASLKQAEDNAPKWEALITDIKGSDNYKSLTDLLQSMQEEMKTLATDLKIDLEK